jgi:hypothetical protein
VVSKVWGCMQGCIGTQGDTWGIVKNNAV